jgi:LPXTG-motif cell wall-anchored protein
MASSIARGARLTALALATGTLLVAATGPAGAVDVKIPDTFGGKAKAAALHIEINLPTAVNVPGLGNVTGIVEDISLVDTATNKALTAAPFATAKAVLGDGTLALLNGKVASASLSGKRDDSSELLGVDNLAGLISANIGRVESHVSPEAAKSVLTSTSSSSLASLKVKLGSVLPTQASLGAVVSTLNNTVNTATGTLTSTLNTVSDKLNALTDGATAPVTNVIKTVDSTLQHTLSGLQSTLGSLGADSELVSVNLLQSTNTVTRNGGTVIAKATAAAGDANTPAISVLGGAVTVQAVKTESVSTANGIKGGAAAKTATTLVGVKVGKVLNLKVDANGISGTLLGNQLPTAANDAVQTALSTINGVLANVAGVHIGVAPDQAPVVDPAGKFASSGSDGAIIEVAPPALASLMHGKSLVKVQFVPASTAVNAARVPSTPNKPVTPNTPSVPETEKHLPHTGAELPLFAILGTGLAGAALVARRRRVLEG